MWLHLFKRLHGSSELRDGYKQNYVPITGVSTRCMFVFAGLLQGAGQHRLVLVQYRHPQGRSECKQVFSMGCDGQGKFRESN